MTVAKIKVSAVSFQQIETNSAEDGDLYRSASAAGALSEKTLVGDESAIGAASSADIMIKTMQNLTGQTIAARTPVAKLADGSIIEADSDGANQQTVIGITLEDIDDEATGRVALIGPNVVNAVLGLGFAPADEVFLSKTGGYTNNAGSLTPGVDSIVRLGFADCASGEASETATDLIMFAEVILRP